MWSRRRLLAAGLSAAWVDEMLTPSQPFNPSYGYLWWLNGQDGYRLPGPDRRLQPGPLVPAAPPDLVAALGRDDQKLYVSRRLGLLVVRLGDGADSTRPGALTSFDQQLWTHLSAARD